jgi:hypothetical protein
MENLIAVLENHLTFKDKATGEIRAIEVQNGHLARYDCSPTNNTCSNRLFGADKPPVSLLADQPHNL